MPVCAKKEINGLANADQGSLQSAKTAAMCTACHDSAHPPPLIPPFCQQKNLSSKWIAPTDNMWPRLHDECTHHQWLKGFCCCTELLSNS